MKDVVDNIMCSFWKAFFALWFTGNIMWFITLNVLTLITYNGNSTDMGVGDWERIFKPYPGIRIFADFKESIFQYKNGNFLIGGEPDKFDSGPGDFRNFRDWKPYEFEPMSPAEKERYAADIHKPLFEY
jgi:hypothetical protein